MTAEVGTPADHRYLQLARTLRKEIVDGVYPVGTQLPTEHELCERFAVSRYTVREALRRLRDDNLVSSRPRAGTMVVARAASNSYAQEVMSINDLLAFAAGAKFDIEYNAMVTLDEELRRTPGCPSVRNGSSCGAFRQADGNAGTDLPHRVLREQGLRRGGTAVATPQRTDLPAHRGPVRGQRRRGPSGDRSSGRLAQARRRTEGRRRVAPHSRCAAPTPPRTGRPPRSPSTPILPRGSATR